MFNIDEIIKNGLNEDITYMDITTDSLNLGDRQAVATLKAKETGIIAGIKAFNRVFEYLDDSIVVEWQVEEGAAVTVGELIAKLSGPADQLLKGERLALNILQRMCGVATMSRAYSQQVESYSVKIVDTRKTTPGLRSLEKYAVRVGGCYNHRYNLSDAVMIKDNHIAAVGSITEAVARIKASVGHMVKIEVEVQDLEQLKEALGAKADVIMLDNMSNAMMAAAVEIADGKAIIEASGGVTFERLVEIAETGVDIISVGALTHSYKSLDISMNIIME